MNLATNDHLIKNILSNAKTIAMVGVSAIKNEDSANIKRRPSTIVMKYMQEFGYRVIPVNPTAVGKNIYGEIVVGDLKDITIPIDVVNIFRPSKETPFFANKATEINAKVLWLQYGIDNNEAKKIAEASNITYISNKCIKQEYQKLFLKMSPVFPVLKK